MLNKLILASLHVSASKTILFSFLALKSHSPQLSSSFLPSCKIRVNVYASLNIKLLDDTLNVIIYNITTEWEELQASTTQYP